MSWIFVITRSIANSKVYLTLVLIYSSSFAMGWLESLVGDAAAGFLVDILLPFHYRKS